MEKTCAELVKKLLKVKARIMMKIDDYMKIPYKMEGVPDVDEGGFVVSFPELPGCLSVGDTFEEAYENALDAKRVWLEAAIEDELSIPNKKELA